MTFGFIGVGAMGGALAASVCKTIGGANVVVFDRDEARTRAFAEQNGAETAESAEAIAARCDYIFLGVKPQGLWELLAQISPALQARTDAVLVSMVAGVCVADVMQKTNTPTIRIMPNTPVRVGEGMILYAADAVSDAQKDGFLKALAGAGRLDPLPESLIDAGCALSGCGPAFAYLYLQALADGGVACGLPREKAVAYAAQTLLGAAKTVLQTGANPERLKDDVCSPAGATIEGVYALERGGVRAAAAEAVRAAFKRTKELG